MRYSGRIPGFRLQIMGRRVKSLQLLPKDRQFPYHKPVFFCFNGGRTSNGGPAGDVVRDLSRRELLILRTLTEGASNKVIALKLVITESTVKVHMRPFCGSLDCRIAPRLRSGHVPISVNCSKMQELEAKQRSGGPLLIVELLYYR